MQSFCSVHDLIVALNARRAPARTAASSLTMYDSKHGSTATQPTCHKPTVQRQTGQSQSADSAPGAATWEATFTVHHLHITAYDGALCANMTS